ncbi:MAG: hypothetical protein U0790_20865 [Isosphaeraceae bacterium]
MIIGLARRAGRQGTVAINAPLTSSGRCCLDDDCCRCRTVRHPQPPSSSATWPAWASPRWRRPSSRSWPGDERIAEALHAVAGHEPLEVYPFATLRLLGLPWRRQEDPVRPGRRKIHRAAQATGTGLNHPRASEHQRRGLCTTALLWRAA